MRAVPKFLRRTAQVNCYPCLFPLALGRNVLSIGYHREQSIVQPADVQGLESSRSLVRLSPLAGMGAGAHQVDRQTYNEQTCAEWLIYTTTHKPVSECLRLSFGKTSNCKAFPRMTFNSGNLADPSWL